MSAPTASRHAQLPGHLALRIALAARTLKGVDTAHLLRALIAAVGEPITEARLRKLRASRLYTRLLETAPADAAAPVIGERQLHSALGLLKGRGVSMPQDPLPVPQSYREGEFEDSVRIACASDSGERMDGSFGGCARFLIYQISPRDSRLIDIRVPAAAAEDDDRYALRAELLHDCQLLYTLSIGGPAAAKVIRAGVHPIKQARALPAGEIVEELQRVLATTPPPWLAKAMGAEPGRRVRFTPDNGL
ncbi:dinitrogenase iron-molybdenum cofactor biosynthesis protein [Pseudomonas sp. GCM10022188]|uniref:dinitrogenase iron-molybdenum cofactor biosynthesis protein n=1 Tax=Pseudomonas TaxID=286 RepID=UPI001E487A76|nr:dinitrogenase iron-molybdenum cofactor biosynthesis protein [Pseudomonas oryzagri]MCC6076268.1 dinitrogenase iron-molybdenum cofactor biosynthesis protein [Pseudomonas oryzagri]